MGGYMHTIGFLWAEVKTGMMSLVCNMVRLGRRVILFFCLYPYEF